MSWNDLKQLLDREWTRRVWTYQEILLASRPVLVCGESHLPWFCLERSLFFFRTLSMHPFKGIIGTWERIVFDRERLSLSLSLDSGVKMFTLQEYADFFGKTLKAKTVINRGFVIVYCVLLIFVVFPVIIIKVLLRFQKWWGVTVLILSIPHSFFFF